MSDEERTERPTPERRQDARREGRVARSRDLTIAASLLGVFLALEGWGPLLADRCLVFTRGLLDQVNVAPKVLQGPELAELGTDLVFFLAYCALPVALASCALVLAAHAGQGAWVFVPHLMTPQLGRVNPLEGIARLVSSRSWLRGLFAGLKLLVVGVLLWQVVCSWLATGGPAVNRAAGWKVLWEGLVGFGVRLSSSLVLLALLEYSAQRWLHERSLRMTRNEIREEAQRQEGDPGIKDRRRRFRAAGRFPKPRPAAVDLYSAETDHAG